MAFDADSLGLQRGAIALVRDLVHERTGLFYEDARVDSMADRLASLVTARGFDSFLDYYYLLKYDEGGSEEWDRVMDALSVPETYFWREIDQLRAVVDEVVPALAARVPAQPIRIWCVPCATGEEPLTLAMMLEVAGWFSKVPIEIRASDASQALVDAARRGLFRERAFRNIPKEIMARFFTREGERWRIDPVIHARILSWTRVNLLAPAEVLPMAAVDIIFCRNVFIYFSDAAIRRVAQVFADQLSMPGYLCIGASESLLRITDRFELERIGEAFVYVKRAASVEGRR